MLIKGESRQGYDMQGKGGNYPTFLLAGQYWEAKLGGGKDLSLLSLLSYIKYLYNYRLAYKNYNLFKTGPSY